MKSFTLYVEDRAVYAKAIADALSGGKGIIITPAQ
jgi:hypothetical protein